MTVLPFTVLMLTTMFVASALGLPGWALGLVTASLALVLLAVLALREGASFVDLGS
ncbi:hypothetical protein ENSA5_16580 [Enhygromyxa salina]|uniref:Uncharacterized protein n=1 Tax=Enhygromyxa salina TaxID=215803 RepID=A0A2S9YE06_9BACT|nr:hypothetical protein [Enhygromyxa salina]PRQ03350.1 hypothetical protein ENSA5_16580 [Enhygromyxa salina]